MKKPQVPTWTHGECGSCTWTPRVPPVAAQGQADAWWVPGELSCTFQVCAEVLRLGSWCRRGKLDVAVGVGADPLLGEDFCAFV